VHPISVLLENRELGSSEKIEEAFGRSWTFREIESFNEELYQTVVSMEEGIRRSTEHDQPFNTFNFVASLSLSGTTGCALPQCRASRAETIARYAALYADRVVVPMPLVEPTTYCRPTTNEAEFSLRTLTMGTVLSLNTMRPVLDVSLVEIVTPLLHFCPSCYEQALGRIERIAKAASGLADTNRKQFSATYDEELAPLRKIKVHGPSEFCEHTDFYQLLFRTPEWLPKTYQAGEVVKLSASVLKKSRIVDELFARLGSQVALQEFLGFRYNAKTVTTNPGELALLSQLDPDQSIYKKSTASLARITHSIPMMEDISLERAVHVRKAESDAFLVYRKALNAVLSEVVKTVELSEKQAKDLVAGVLVPEIARLRMLADAEGVRAKTKAKVHLAVAGAVLSLAFFGGLLPSELATIGGAVSLQGLLESLAELRASPKAVRSQNFYYLLRLNR
jgi:hypothetical protein